MPTGIKSTPSTANTGITVCTVRTGFHAGSLCWQNAPSERGGFTELHEQLSTETLVFKYIIIDQALYSVVKPSCIIHETHYVTENCIILARGVIFGVGVERRGRLGGGSPLGRLLSVSSVIMSAGVISWTGLLSRYTEVIHRLTQLYIG